MSRLQLHKELSKKQQFELTQKEQWKSYWQNPPEPDLKRIERTWQLVEKNIPTDLKTLDIGAGDRLLTDRFPNVTAVDIAPLKNCQYGLFPYLDYPDGSFQCLILADLIAELPQALHRLALSEAARLLEPKGYLICSTPLDRKSEGAVAQFCQLINTEFEIMASHKSYPYFERLSKLFFGDEACSHIIIISHKRSI